ncbi:putative MDR permease [Sporolactobacillus inulinus]|uniref:Putative MDR permease n=1 Tax=Sporolactobacillus inulinus TaxID=2078 RepID=A0A4Y1ZHG8_9BACL|nr:MFS transporter [Sporolactobacillus inulinus]GAY78403.1 putative MDR permease [Sporolactobacillus inulinus]
MKNIEAYFFVELMAALLVTPISISIFIMSPIAGLLFDRIGARLTIFTGFLLMALAYFSYYHLNVAHGYFGLMMSCVALGAGFGMIVGPITVLAAADFKGELLTASQSVAGVLRQLGSVLAVGIFILALTGAVCDAKSASIHDAEKHIVALNLSEEDQNRINHQIAYQINHQSHPSDQPAVSKTKEKALVTHVADKIRAKTSHQMTQAFASLYGKAFPFAILSCLLAFIYKKRVEKGRLVNENGRGCSRNPS